MRRRGRGDIFQAHWVKVRTLLRLRRELRPQDPLVYGVFSPQFGRALTPLREPA
jgi:hypothetical protein